MAKSKKLEGSDLEKETLLLDVEELEQKTSRERATKIATSRRLAQAWIFALDISYGMYGTLSSYFLTEIIYGTDDDEKAVGLSTYYMIVWCSCNFLTAPVLGSVTDLVGRRPILLIGALTDTLAFPFMAAARTPTAVLLGAACIGTLDCTYNVCKSIIVDAVVAAKRNGARGSKDFCEDLDFGGPRDWWPSRLLYGHAFKGGAASVDLPLLLTRELSVLNVYSIFGLLLGVWLGETLMLSIGVRLAFACVGVVLLPADLWLAYALPESLEDAPPARRCCGVPSRATTKNVLNPMTSLRFLCGNSHRVRALVCTYFVGNLGLYGVSSIILYWLEDHFKFGSVQITSMYFNSIIVGPIFSLEGLLILATPRAYSPATWRASADSSSRRPGCRVRGSAEARGGGGAVRRVRRRGTTTTRGEVVSFRRRQGTGRGDFPVGWWLGRPPSSSSPCCRGP